MKKYIYTDIVVEAHEILEGEDLTSFDLQSQKRDAGHFIVKFPSQSNLVVYDPEDFNRNFKEVTPEHLKQLEEEAAKLDQKEVE